METDIDKQVIELIRAATWSHQAHFADRNKVMELAPAIMNAVEADQLAKGVAQEVIEALAKVEASEAAERIGHGHLQPLSPDYRYKYEEAAYKFMQSHGLPYENELDYGLFTL